jgi:hypothetical protein
MCSRPLGGAGKGYECLGQRGRVTKNFTRTLADSETDFIQVTDWSALLIMLVCDSATADVLY